MKRLAALLIVAGSLGLAGGAQAHNSHGWYWGEGRAEDNVYDRYYDVEDVYCDGFGHRWHGLYKHFDCSAELDDGETLDFTLHVISRTRFKITE